jgi:hypothetical protein
MQYRPSKIFWQGTLTTLSRHIQKSNGSATDEKKVNLPIFPIGRTEWGAIRDDNFPTCSRVVVICKDR